MEEEAGMALLLQVVQVIPAEITAAEDLVAAVPADAVLEDSEAAASVVEVQAESGNFLPVEIYMLKINSQDSKYR